MACFNEQKKQTESEQILDQINQRKLKRSTNSERFLEHKPRVEPVRQEDTSGVGDCVSNPIWTKPQQADIDHERQTCPNHTANNETSKFSGMRTEPLFSSGGSKPVLSDTS